MPSATKRETRADALERAAWVGARVAHKVHGHTGTVAERFGDWYDDNAPACKVKFDDERGEELALVPWADLRPADVACSYDIGKGTAELRRRKVATPATCGRIYSPKTLTEPERARCPSCDKVADAIEARHARRYRRQYLASVRLSRATMPRLYSELRRINRAKRCWYLIPHVARSGMSRRIELFYPEKGGGVDVVWPDYEPGEGTTPAQLEALRRRIDWSRAHRCFVVGGCGMDMVFATVDHLGSVFGFENWGNKIQRSGLSRAE